MTSAISSPIKWAGGKRKLVDVLLGHLQLPANGKPVFVEPFLGSGIVTLTVRETLPHVRCFAYDKNDELVNLFTVIREMPASLITALSTAKYVYDQKRYYEIRSEEPMNPVEAAARTIYLNRCGFNGLYRLNLKGKFNVPFGDYSNPRICDAASIERASKALQGVELLAIDFSEAIYPDGCFVYADPPYVPVSKTSSFTSYAGAFGPPEQKRLATFLDGLRLRGCRVVASNSDTEAVRDLYLAKDWEVHELDVARSISAKGSTRGKAKELIMVGRKP